MEVWFGRNVRGKRDDGVYEGFRRRWRELVGEKTGGKGEMGWVLGERERVGGEAEALRREVAAQVRKDVLAVRGEWEEGKGGGGRNLFDWGFECSFFLWRRCTAAFLGYRNCARENFGCKERTHR